MREILFRGKQMIAGKRVDNAEWVYGDVMFARGEDGAVKSAYMRYIEMPENADKNGGDRIVGTMQLSQVEPETVGQFTGLTDKNGVKIFEGDVVKHYNNSFEECDIGRVFWSQKLCEYRRTTSLPDAQFRPVDYCMRAYCEYEVIGNIHDKGGEAK